MPELGHQYIDAKPVHVSDYGFSGAQELLYTDGLGPCIGVCIAWKTWAGIVHLGSLDEHDLLPKFLGEAKEFLPPDVSNIHPIICGGDPDADAADSHDSEDSAAAILEARNVVLEVLEKAGFGKAHVQWNEAGQTSCLVAYLKHGFVCVENNIGDDKKYDILDFAGVGPPDA